MILFVDIEGVLIQNRKNHKKDAALSGLKYIDAKEFKDEN